MKYILLLIFLLATSAFALDLPPGLLKLAEHYQTLANNVTFLVAFLAGILTFTSSCGFVILPTFFSVVFKERKRAVLMTIAFSLGLALAFTLFGVIAGLLGDFFNIYKRTFATLSGIMLIFFGALLLFNKGFGLFFFKIDHANKKSFFSILSLGFFFAIGWTPCVGPVLSSMMLLAANTGSLPKAILFFLTYSVGIATPLLLIALLSDKYDLASKLQGRTLSFHLFGKKHYTHTYNLIGGTFLLFLGTIMLTYQGTTFFQTTIPNTLWNMNLYTWANNTLLNNQFFKTTTANIIGLIIAAALISYTIYKTKT